MNVNTSFVFGTWNAGTDARDYSQLFSDNRLVSAETPNISGLADNAEDNAVWNSIVKARFDLLSETATTLSRQADVLALQEVNGNSRPEIQKLMSKGYSIHRRVFGNDFTDTAIAINPAKFDSIKNATFITSSGSDFAGVTATEKATGKRVAFFSGHITGFNLENPDEYDMKHDAAFGDEDIQELVDHIKTACDNCDTVMIGLDMNSIPEIYRPRFDLFTNAGFTLHRTNRPTSNFARNFSGKTPNLQARELDYILTYEKPRSAFLRFFDNLFGRKTEFQVHTSKDISLTPITNPSDHIPVFVRVNSFIQKNFIQRFLDLFR